MYIQFNFVGFSIYKLAVLNTSAADFGLNISEIILGPSFDVFP
jgi:hypothetical protein